MTPILVGVCLLLFIVFVFCFKSTQKLSILSLFLYYFQCTKCSKNDFFLFMEQLK